MSRYFQGSSVTGTVRVFPGQSFRDVVDAFRVCPTLPMTRAMFMALDKKSRNDAKQVPFFVPACFKSSPSKRVYSEAVHCNLIFLDIDSGTDAAPYVRNPQLLYQVLEGFNFAAHTTASSTAENPRMRVVVEANEIPVERYREAVETIAALLALTNITSESKVAVQAMFAPVRFKDSTDADHPLIAHHLDGRSFAAKDISAEGTDHYHTAKASIGSNGANGHSPDALFFLKAPVPEITLAIAKEALAKIDADVDRAQWRDIASALRHQFSHQQDDEAYEIFDEWSARGNKYLDSDDTLKMWRSLRPTPNGRMPVTIRSLLHWAVEAGWSDKAVKDNSFARLVEWMENIETATDLLEQGVKKIMAAPLLSGVQESMLVDEMRKCLKRRWGHNVQATAIKQDLAKLKSQVKAKEREEQRKTEKTRTPSWADGFLYVSSTGDYYKRHTGEVLKEATFNATFSDKLLPTEEQLQAAGIAVNPLTLCRPIIPPADYVRNHLKIPKVHDYSYDPSQPNEVFFIENTIKYVNTYTPNYPDADESSSVEAGKLFLTHVRNLIAEPENQRVLMDYLAFMVQQPGRKTRWAVMIQGAEGCGKTLIAEVVKAVLGKDNVKTIDGETVVSGWNDWAFGYQVVVLEEVRVQGSNRYDIMNRLKPWVTNDDIPINEKFRSSRDVRNITNYLLFSNHHDALALTPNDRRYFVVKSPLQTKTQVLALGNTYFPRLFKMIKNQAGGLRHFFLNWEISADFNPDGHPPRTTYVQELINDSASDTVAAVRRLISEGDSPLVQYDIVSAKTLQLLLTEVEGLHNVTGQQLAHVLREEGYSQIGRHAFGEERHYLWVRAGVDQNTAAAEAAERVRRDLKNLCMELLFS